MRKGKYVSLLHASFYIRLSDLQTLTEEIYDGVDYWRSGSQERVHTAMQQIFSTSADEDVDDVKSLRESYHKYKRGYAKHHRFNPYIENLCKYYPFKLSKQIFAATTLEHAPLEAVYIYFDTATYDEIERDEKVALDDNELTYR